MALKQKLASRISDIILAYVRGKKGRLTIISDESRINRNRFNTKELPMLRMHQMLRIFYALMLVLPSREFLAMMNEMYKVMEEFANDYDYVLLDEKQSECDQ